VQPNDPTQNIPFDIADLALPNTSVNQQVGGSPFNQAINGNDSTDNWQSTQYVHDVQEGSSSSEPEVMEGKISRVLEEVSQYQRKTGKRMTPNQLKNVCSCINDEYGLSKPSLLDLQETYQPKLTVQSQVPNGMSTSPGGTYEFASAGL
jgi:hypothetical protein